MTARVLDVVDLSITYDGIAAVRDVSFHIDAGEVVALIGRSGAGKSSIISAIMDLLPPHAVVGGSFHVSGHTRADVDGGMWRNRMVGLVPQNPFSWFNPMIRLHKQLAETMGSDYARDRRERRRHADALLRQVGFVDTKRIARARPHELSGGMRQRAAIAAALTHRPPLVLADEPTSALDPESQSQILELLAECRAFGQAVLLVSHEAAVVERLANRVLYLDNGVLVDEMARNTLELTSRPSIMDEVVVMQARRLAVSYPHVPIVHDFDFGIRRGETVALVGESGSGKSTLCRIFGGFGSPEVGEVVFDGTPVQMLSRRDRANMVQTVFQDVRGSLDSRLTARRCVERRRLRQPCAMGVCGCGG
jgi:peptide/nickel transport system ATP-binding protein